MKGDHLGEFEEFTLLAIRAVGDDTYAVPLQQFIEEATGRAVSLGTVYSALTRLEDKGYVRSSMSEAIAARGGKPRRLYVVTPLGLRTMKDLHKVRLKMWRAITERSR
jgi:PadR family transcriptional regulator, regulatory protein PadR